MEWTTAQHARNRQLTLIDLLVLVVDREVIVLLTYYISTRRTRNLYNFIKQLKTVYSLDIINVIDSNNGVQYPQRRGGVGPVGRNTFCKLQVWYGHYAVLYLSKG